MHCTVLAMAWALVPEGGGLAVDERISAASARGSDDEEGFVGLRHTHDTSRGGA